MIVQFSGQNNGNAVLVASAFRGWIVAWGFAPFWLGKNATALAQVQGVVPGGFNLELRDGVYCNSNPTGPGPGPSPQPLTIPWSGDIYVLDGAAPGDSKNNVAIIQLMPDC